MVRKSYFRTTRRTMRRKYRRRANPRINIRILAVSVVFLLAIIQAHSLLLQGGVADFFHDLSEVDTDEGLIDIRREETPSSAVGIVGAVSRGSDERSLVTEEVAVNGDNAETEKSLKTVASEKLLALAIPGAKGEANAETTLNADVKADIPEESPPVENGSIVISDAPAKPVGGVGKTWTGTVDNSQPEVLIYHTHATEAYMPLAENSSHSTEESGTVREVGTYLVAALNERGVSALQDKTLHDSPSFNKSYNRSLETVKSLLSTYPSAKMIIDLHRDAASSSNNAPVTVNIGEETVASFCLVVGTGNTNVERLRAKAQEIKTLANQLYPGICTKIVERPYKFNGYLSDNFILLEVGNNANTIEQTIASTKYIAEILSQVLN